MRRLLVLCALLTCTAASPPAAGPDPDWPAAPDIGKVMRSLEDAEKVCRDRIHSVREERGLPAIERESTDPEALLIAAVDHRIDGCSVMVMKHDTRDVRPIPKPDESAPLLRKIQ